MNQKGWTGRGLFYALLAVVALAGHAAIGADHATAPAPLIGSVTVQETHPSDTAIWALLLFSAGTMLILRKRRL